MKLEYIVTLANEPVHLPFMAFERSLRATGCELPLLVIPYDDRKFELPNNAEWWENKRFLAFIDEAGNRPVMRKYQVLLLGNFQFLDTDAVFLKNPAEALVPHQGWINSCCHWHNPNEATTEPLRDELRKLSTTWPKTVFNSGQFACDKVLYSCDSLIETLQKPVAKKIALDDEFHEQPGMNLLAHLADVPIKNLTLPPYNMESTWAGDYSDKDFEATWQGEAKPYLLHWAGRKMAGEFPIDRLSLDLLTESERREWLDQLKSKPALSQTQRFKRGIRAATSALRDGIKSE